MRGVIRVYMTKGGKYTYGLFAPSGREIARGNEYETFGGVEGGIQSFLLWTNKPDIEMEAESKMNNDD